MLYLNKDNFVLKGQESNLNITHLKNLKGIDFGDCPYILRTQYKVNDIYDQMSEESKNKFINNLAEPLDSSACENQKITIVSKPPLETLYYFQSIKKFQPFYQAVKEDIEIFNDHSKYYKDFCYPFIVLNKYDLTLNQRREFLQEYKENWALLDSNMPASD